VAFSYLLSPEKKNEVEHAAALALRDAVLRLHRDGAFVAVPLWQVNEDPRGPHPVGSYEIWCHAPKLYN
jgi:DOPA 4,5-dioxygenase